MAFTAYLTGVGPIISLNAATAVGGGTTADFGVPARFISCTFEPSAALTGGSVTLEFSPDGIFWVELGASLTATNLGASGAGTLVTNTLAATANSVFRYARARILTTITGGTVTAVINAA